MQLARSWVTDNSAHPQQSSRTLSFGIMWSIHPSQVDYCDKCCYFCYLLFTTELNPLNRTFRWQVVVGRSAGLGCAGFSSTHEHVPELRSRLTFADLAVSLTYQPGHLLRNGGNPSESMILPLLTEQRLPICVQVGKCITASFAGILCSENIRRGGIDDLTHLIRKKELLIAWPHRRGVENKDGVSENLKRRASILIDKNINCNKGAR